MEPRKLTALTAAMMIANMTPEDQSLRYAKGSHNREKPAKAKKCRAKVKAARKANKRRGAVK